ncbi:hypothetical protein Vadar_023266 [Vaccinium darrowii]|uniref:Uncharacterized protein n=1 Tax=Vaccinium darrowii TaxID=229202 RepID=A0ACB7X3P8_9ERIC|nr:hypothetical protein Vadar_023266 [Vaccinium darrowii]
MVVEKEDLGLSLSLRRFPEEINRPSSLLQLNLMPPSSSFSTSLPFNAHKASSNWIHNFPPSLGGESEASRVVAAGAETRSLFKGIDVNQIPSSPTGDCCEEEVGGVSSPNSTISSLSGTKRNSSERRDINNNDQLVALNNNINGDHEVEIDDRTTSSHGIISDEDDGDGSRKKLRLSKDQSAVLEDSFKEHNTLNPKQKLALAKRLGLRPRQVEVWFQNRRARTKLKQTEVDCEFLKRCCENLTEENRRLQKEVQELRALKLSPQFYMQMTPPTTLTMCPSCERVGPPSSIPSTTTIDRVRSRQVTATAHHRPGAAAFDPWASARPIITHRMFDGLLQPRS